MAERAIDRTDIDQVLAALTSGNRRFVSGRPRADFSAAAREKLARSGQAPFAAVLGCSDSRVPVEIVFDAQPGDIFVVRTAGHVLAPASLASLHFAVEGLGVRLIVVLGHDDCGAVKAVLFGQAPEWFRPIGDHVHVPATGTDRSTGNDEERIASAVEAHVRETCAELRRSFEDAGFSGRPPRIVGAAYRLATGEVHWL